MSKQHGIDFSGVPQVEQPVEPQVPEDEKRGVLADSAVGIVDGVRDGVQNTMQAFTDGANAIDEALGAGRVVFGDDAENGIVGYRSGDEIEAAGGYSAQPFELPDFEGESHTVVGSVVHDISQFAIGFVGGQRALSGVGWAGKTFVSGMGKGMVAGGIADSTAFDPRKEGLADLLNQVPVLNNIVPDYFNTDPNDTIGEARLKKFIEGMYWGTAGEALFHSLRSMKNAAFGNKEVAEEAAGAAEGALTKETAETVEAAEPVAVKEGEEAIAKEGDEAVEATPEPEPVTVISKKTQIEIERRLLEIKPGQSVDEALEGIDFNFNNMTSEDSVKETINVISSTISKQIDNAKGGVRTHDETAALADALGDNPDALVEKLRSTFGEVQDLDSLVVSSKIMMQGLSDEVFRLATVVGSEQTNDQIEAQLVLAVKKLADVTAMYKGVQTNIARAQSAQRIKTGSTFSREQLDDIITGAGGLDKVNEIAKRIRSHRGELKGTVATVEKGWTAKGIDIHNEYWINALLSGVTTHAINITSAAIQGTLLPVERMIGAGLSGDVRGMREGLAELTGLVTYSMQALKGGGRAAWKGESILDGFEHGTNETINQALNARNLNLQEGSLAAKGANLAGNVIRLPSRALQAEDEFFKQLTYRSRVAARAQMEALDKRLSPQEAKAFIQKKMDDAFDVNGKATDKEALQAAREATFTQDLEYGLSHSVQKFFIKHPGLKFIAPFVRTPSNLLRTTWQHTPILNRKQQQLMDDLKAGGSRAQVARGKMAMGNALYASAGMLVYNDMVTGGAPRDPEEREALMATGWRPYSYVRTDENGKKTYVPYGRLDPYGMVFGLMADMKQLSGRMEDEEFKAVAWAALAAVANNVSSKAYLQGMSKQIETIASGDPKAWERAGLNQLGTYVPNFFNQNNDDEALREVRNWMDAFMARTPGQSDKLPPRRSVLGEVIPRSHNALPWQTSEDTGEDVYRELAELGAPISASPETMGNVNMVEFKNKKGQDAYDRYLELQGTVKINGRTLKESLQKLMSDPSYQRRPKDTDEYTSWHHKRIRQVVGRYRDKAEGKLRKESFTHAEGGKELFDAIKADKKNRARVPHKGLDALESLTQ